MDRKLWALGFGFAWNALGGATGCGVSFDVPACRQACEASASCESGVDLTACLDACDALQTPDVSGAEDCIGAYNEHNRCVAEAGCGEVDQRCAGALQALEDRC